MSDNEQAADDDRHILYLSGRVTMVLMEWMPIGLHTIKFLQDKLECEAEYHDFFVTQSIDRDRNASTVNIGLAEVMIRVEEHVPLEYLRFAARINIEKTGSAHQQEVIGIQVARSGQVNYGLELITPPDNPLHSVDEISYIVADLIEDSSRAMDTVLNSYQKRLLDIVFCEQSSQREKFVIIMAEEMAPECTDVHHLYSDPPSRSELRHHPWGYPGVLTLMLVIVLTLVFVFWRAGLLKGIRDFLKPSKLK